MYLLIAPFRADWCVVLVLSPATLRPSCCELDHDSHIPADSQKEELTQKIRELRRTLAIWIRHLDLALGLASRTTTALQSTASKRRGYDSENPYMASVQSTSGNSADRSIHAFAGPRLAMQWRVGAVLTRHSWATLRGYPVSGSLIMYTIRLRDKSSRNNVTRDGTQLCCGSSRRTRMKVI